MQVRKIIIAPFIRKSLHLQPPPLHLHTSTSEKKKKKNNNVELTPHPNLSPTSGPTTTTTTTAAAAIQRRRRRPFHLPTQTHGLPAVFLAAANAADAARAGQDLVAADPVLLPARTHLQARAGRCRARLAAVPQRDAAEAHELGPRQGGGAVHGQRGRGQAGRVDRRGFGRVLGFLEEA